MERTGLEQRVEEIARELAVLRERVDALTSREPAEKPIVPAALAAAAPKASEDAGEELIRWVGASSLLPRTAAVCFLMVIALILRTVTDNGILDQQVGSWIGMTYAALLIAGGWFLYSRGGALAPVFTVCGAALMYIIAIETHARFETLSSLPAYLILLATGMATATISYLYSHPLPVLVGTLGMGMAGVAVDYPNPYFPFLALLLLIANLIGAYATRLQRCSWLRWILLGLTATMVQVWAIKISMAGQRKGLPAAALGEAWFLPVLTLFAVAFFGTAMWAAMRPGEERVSRFDLALPAISSAWVFAAAGYVLRSQEVYLVLLGLLGLILAAGSAGFAAWLKEHRRARKPAVIAYLTAAVILLAVGMGFASSGVLAPLAAASLAAVALLVLSERWRSGGIRLLSYLVQSGCAISLAIVLLEREPAMRSGAQLLAAAIIAGCGLWLFRKGRTTAPPEDSAWFERFDREDRVAVLLLLGGLLCGFFLVRIGIYLVLQQGGTAPSGGFQAGQTVVINLAAALLMVLAYFRGRNRELRNVAILVALIAGGKVFFRDLIGIDGVPLVTSVFSFGVTISLISLALTGWSRPDGRRGGEGDAGERLAVAEDPHQQNT